MPKTGSDLIINGEIILSGSVILDDWAGFMWDEDVFFCPRMVREALTELGEGRVTVRLNSLGGHVWAGEQIRTILAGHPGGCRIVVEGIAASAASLLFMAGAERLMSAGSMLMIHDPSGAAWGTEDDLRREAEALGASANVYATVYASASGKSPEDVREIMKAETWYGPEAAIAAGFADAIVEDPGRELPPPVASIDRARAAFASAGQDLRLRLAQKPEPAVPARSPSAAPSGSPAATATAMEAHMPNDNPAAPAVTTTTPPVAAAAPDAVAQERARVRAIREMAAPFVLSGRLTQAEVDVVLDDGTSAEAASVRFMTTMAAAEPAGRSVAPGARGAGPTATITRDETDTRLEGMIGALMQRTDGPAEQFRGLRLRTLAMDLAGPRRSYNEAEAIRAGMRSTTMMGGSFGVSDFAYITTEVMNRSLLAAYERRAANWQAVCGAPISASDFREIHAVRFGGDFSLKKVNENGEYQQATLSDEAEGLKVERRGRTITITFEAVINDNMDAFRTIPTEFAEAARIMEASMVWSLLRTNAKLKSDGKALFHADHGNLANTGAAISDTSVAIGRKAMWEQRAFGSSDKDDFLQIEPDRLIVPPALELPALRFKTSTMPNADGSVNPYKSTLEPIVAANLSAIAGGSDTAWYLISSRRPPIQHAYLEGYNAPTVQTRDGMNPDAVTMDARHIFGAAAVEFRGAYKNPGQ